MTDFLGTCIDLGVKIKSNFEQAGQNRNDCSALSADIVDSLNQIVETLQHHMLAPPDELRDNISQFENELRSILSRQQRLYKQSKNGVWGSSMKKIQEFYYADDIKNQLVELRQNLQTCNQKLQLSSTLRVEGRVATVSNQVISLQQKQEAMLNLLESLVPGSNPTRVAALSRIEEVMEDRRSVIEYDGTLQPPQEVAYGSITSRNDSLAALSIVNSISVSLLLLFVKHQIANTSL
ncbi:hypothetical protein FRC03_007023 [Tulasnella sp. 419]|nr:hypothetical protein FRC03_007023 [Tulasnella sp. 419]